MDEYLKALVNFYPVSSNQDAVSALLRYAKERFERAGLQTELLTYDGVHNLYASTAGKKHVRVLLQSHIDVVPGESQPFKMTEDSYEGRGTFDMLFAAACYFKLLDDLGGKLDQLDLGFYLSGDEELGGDKGVKAFLDAGYTADVVVLPDAGTEYGTLCRGAKGVYEPTIRIHGKSHHGSRPWEGDGAASKLVHFLSEAEELFDTTSRENTTMTVAKLTAGDAGNRGPAFADVSLDIRYKDKADLARTKDGLKALLSKYDGEITEELDGDDYQLDMSLEPVQRFLKMYKDQIGKEIELFTAPGSSDARFFISQHTPVIMWRPDGGGAHGDNEWISRESTEMFYRLLKDYVTAAV